MFYAESDVDVVIRLDSVFHYDVSALNAQELGAFNAALIPGTYPYADYKADVVEALEESFEDDVKPGTKAIKIKANGSRRSADVVVATEFRRCYSGLFGVQFERGICFFDSSGDPDRQLSKAALGKLHNQTPSDEWVVQADGANPEKHAQQPGR